MAAYGVPTTSPTGAERVRLIRVCPYVLNALRPGITTATILICSTLGRAALATVAIRLLWTPMEFVLFIKEQRPIKELNGFANVKIIFTSLRFKKPTKVTKVVDVPTDLVMPAEPIIARVLYRASFKKSKYCET